jgi:hypothetical protein
LNAALLGSAAQRFVVHEGCKVYSLEIIERRKSMDEVSE